MKKFIISILLLTTGLSLMGQQKRVLSDDMFMMDVDALTDQQLDTVNVKKKLKINDYV